MRGRPWAAWLLLVYYAIAGWPGDYPPVATGLDESWIYAINALFHAGPVFGSEVAFTYGPLGFLLHPRAVEGNLARGLAFWIAMHLTTVALLAFSILRKRVWQACGTAALVILAQTLEVWPEYWAAMNAGLWAIASLLLPLPAWPWAIATGLLAGLLTAGKLTSGVASLSVVAAAFLVLPAPLDRKRRMAALAAGSLVAVWLPVYFSHFNGPASFFQWLKWSSEISSGYAAAMSIVFQPETLWNALTVAVAYAVFLAAGGSRMRRIALAFLPLLFVAFRHGYVRQGIHSTAFYGTACAVAALIFLFTENRRDRLAVLGLAGACAAVMLYHCNRPNSGLHRSLAATRDHLSLSKGFRRLGQTLNLAGHSAELAASGQAAALSGGPPGRWPEIIRADFGRVASLPWEITGLTSSGLSWQLLPSLQLYSAYTQELDRATARVFAGQDRPKWIWLMNAGIDRRSLFTDNPETWLAILDHYSVAATHGPANQMLLRARDGGFATQTAPVSRHSTVEAGRWVDADLTGALWRVEIGLQPTLWGRLARYVYQWPPVFIEVERARGDPRKIRILPDTASAGLFMPLLPLSIEEFSAAFSNRVDNPVKRFRILLPEGGYFDNSIQLRWKQTTRVFTPPP